MQDHFYVLKKNNREYWRQSSKGAWCEENYILDASKYCTLDFALQAANNIASRRDRPKIVLVNINIEEKEYKNEDIYVYI